LAAPASSRAATKEEVKPRIANEVIKGYGEFVEEGALVWALAGDCRQQIARFGG
jgi:hypothetical protein